MCPFCLAAIGLVVVKAASAGGLTAVAVKLSRKKDKVNEIANSNERSNQDVNPNSR